MVREYFYLPHILLISGIDNHVLGTLYHNLFKVIRTLEQGDTCSKPVIKFKKFDCCVEFHEEMPEIWLCKRKKKGFLIQKIYVIFF